MIFLWLGILSYLPFVLIADLRQALPGSLAAFLPPMLLWFFSYRAAERGDLSLPWMLIAALAVRLLLIPTQPTLSEDVYRYLWDGALVSNGYNPYLEPPEALEDFQGRYPRLYDQMAHTDRTSIYPPFAQLFFLANHLLWGPTPTGWKGFLLVLEITLIFLYARRFKTRCAQLVLWTLNPLVILEFYSSGHMDLLALVAFLVAIQQRQEISAEGPARPIFLFSLSYSLAINAKLFPILALPILVSRLPRGRIFWLSFPFFLTLPFGTLLLVFGSPLSTLSAFANILKTYRDIWQFNSLLFTLLEPFRDWLLLVTQVVLLGILLLLTWRPGQPDLSKLPARLTLLLLSLLALSSAVHPWYLTWPLMFYPLLPQPFKSGLVFSGLLLASYLLYWPNLPHWASMAFLTLEYSCFYWLFSRDLFRHLKQTF